MEPKALIINSAEKPSLYPGIKITINGETYLAKRSTRPMWRTLRDLEKRIREGDFTAYYEQVEVMTNAPAEAVDTLDIQEVKQIIEYIISKNQNPGEGTDNLEKKASLPGETKPSGSPEISPGSSTLGT